MNKRNWVTLTQAEQERPWTSVRWLRRQIYVGNLPSYKVAGRVLVDLNELDAIVESGRREPEAA